MANLSQEQQREMIVMLACYNEPKAIIEHFGESYGLDVSYRQVLSYDAASPHCDCAVKWQELFAETRKAHLADVAAVPSAHQAFRMNLLHKLTMKAVREDKPALAAQLLEQSAKEVGGMLTNQRELRVDDNRRQRPIDMAPEDRRAVLVEILRKAIEERQALAPPIEGSVTAVDKVA